MKRMDDKEFFGAAASEPLFRAGPLGSGDSCTSPTKINIDAAAGAEALISGVAETASIGRTGPLDRVTDPELREIMEIVLDEDADLIAYLRHR